MLQSMRSRRVGYYWGTEQQQSITSYITCVLRVPGKVWGEDIRIHDLQLIFLSFRLGGLKDGKSWCSLRRPYFQNGERNGNPLQYFCLENPIDWRAWQPTAHGVARIEHAAAAPKSLQSCLTLCDPTDSSPPGSAVSGILQARTVEWVAISFSNAWKWKVKVKSLSRVRLLAIPWTAV